MTEILTGKVKWFNTTKGYGFITPDVGGEDVFVHQSSIYSQGFRSLAEGETVEYKTLNEGGRVKAVDVTGPNGDYIQPPPNPRFNRGGGGFGGGGFGGGRGGYGGGRGGGYRDGGYRDGGDRGYPQGRRGDYGGDWRNRGPGNFQNGGDNFRGGGGGDRYIPY